MFTFTSILFLQFVITKKRGSWKEEHRVGKIRDRENVRDMERDGERFGEIDII